MTRQATPAEKKGVALKCPVVPFFAKKRCFSGIHPGRLTAGTLRIDRLEKGTSSEPNHHFQVLCLSFGVDTDTL